jgi:hypothetical protein
MKLFKKYTGSILACSLAVMSFAPAVSADVPAVGADALEYKGSVVIVEEVPYTISDFTEEDAFDIKEGLPPGLAKMGELPPGLAKMGELPSGLAKGSLINEDVVVEEDTVIDEDTVL